MTKSTLYFFLFVLFIFNVSTIEGQNVIDSSVVISEKSQNLTIQSRMFELSISVDDKEFCGQNKINVQAKIKNLSQEIVTLDDLKFVSFYLSKYDKYEIAKAIESEVFVGYYAFITGGSEKVKLQIPPNKEYEFEIDLMSLAWNDQLLSIRGRDSINKLPKGKYNLYMQLSLPDEQISTKWDRRFNYFTSNEIPFWLKNK